MGSQVAVAEVAVVPTFKGFRRKVSSETDSSATEASRGFSRIFSKTGTDTGKATGAGFKRAFEQSAQGASDKVTKQLEANVAKSARAVSDARLKEQDAAGKVRVAEAQLAEVRKEYADDSSQVIRAQERMETASRNLRQAHERTEDATENLKGAQGDLARAADRAGDELADAGTRGVNGFRSNVVGGVKSFALPLIGAFAALGIGNIVADAFREAKDFFLGSIDIASDLNESVNAVEVAYGDAANEILKLGDNSAKTFGLSRKDLNEYSTQFSAFVKTIAGEGGNFVGTLETLVGRGTDFASVFNVDVSEALGLFQSGLAGETEPLRKYGIDLSAAAVEAYALANGIGDGVGELTEAEKVQARYGKLLQDTNNVAGDFVNTSDELANKNRINAAEWENVRAKLGDAFLPVASQLADILGDDVIPVIAQLAEEEGPALAEAFAEILPDLTQLAKDLLPLLPDLVKAFADGLPVVIEMISGTAEVLGPLITDLGGFLGGMQLISDFINGDMSLQDMLERVEGLGGGFGQLLRDLIALVVSVPVHLTVLKVNVIAKINEILGFIGSIPGRIQVALTLAGVSLRSSGIALMQTFLDGIKSMVEPIVNTVSNLLSQVQEYFPHSPAKRGPLSGAGWTRLRKSGEAFWDQWMGGMGGDEPPFPAFPRAPGGSGVFPGGASAVAAEDRAVYVQNPWGPEYMRAQTAAVADRRAAARGEMVTRGVRNRRWADA